LTKEAVGRSPCTLLCESFASQTVESNSYLRSLRLPPSISRASRWRDFHSHDTSLLSFQNKKCLFYIGYTRCDGERAGEKGVVRTILVYFHVIEHSNKFITKDVIYCDERDVYQLDCVPHFEDYLSSKVPMLIQISGDISGLSDMGSLKNAGGLPHTSCLWSSDNLRTQPALPLGNCFLQVQRAHLWVSNSNDEMMSLVT